MNIAFKSVAGIIVGLAIVLGIVFAIGLPLNLFM